MRFGACLALRTDRVVVGTPAAQNPHRVSELAEKRPGRIARTVDVRQDRVMIEGLKVQGGYTARAFIESLRDTPFGARIVSHIGADTARHDSAAGVISARARAARVPVIASGVVRTVGDVARPRRHGTPHGALDPVPMPAVTGRTRGRAVLSGGAGAPRRCRAQGAHRRHGDGGIHARPRHRQPGRHLRRRHRQGGSWALAAGPHGRPSQSSASVIQTGTWSDGLSPPRTALSIPAPVSLSAACGVSR